jgi:predicted Rdx family selenoprotein
LEVTPPQKILNPEKKKKLKRFFFRGGGRSPYPRKSVGGHPNPKNLKMKEKKNYGGEGGHPNAKKLKIKKKIE